MIDKYIFGYGSLLNKSSIKSALGRDVDHFILGEIVGYQRLWSAVEMVKPTRLDFIIRAVFLDIQQEESSKINGIIIKVSEDEINRLKRREKNYDCIEVTDDVVFHDENSLPGKIYTFTSKIEFRLKPEDTNEDTYVMTQYEKKVLSAALSLGSEFYSEFIRTTSSHSLNRIDGEYQFIDPEQESLV